MNRLKYLSLFFLSTLILAGCAGRELDTLSLFQRLQMNLAYEKAEYWLEKDRPGEAAQTLWNSAAKIQPPYRQLMQVRAAEIMLDHSHLLSARRYLVKIDETPLTERSLLRKRIAEARFYKETAQYEKVLSALPADLIKQGDKALKIGAFRVTADAWAETGELVAMIKTRMALHQLLEKEQRANNIKQLWSGLLFSDPQKALQEKQKDHPKRIHIWLELALLATPETIDIQSLSQQLADWQNKHKQWPLPESVQTEMVSRWQYLDFSPKKIAVLLPLTGTYAKIGRIVQSGFLSDHEDSTPDFTVHFYNTDTEQSTLELYQKAVDTDGADMIIGPLLKQRVDELAAAIVSVPTISLNYAQTNPSQRSEFFQFGLLPEDEAIQLAQQVWGNGHHFALVLTPNTDWGQRLYDTFTDHYLELGGTIRDSLYYDPNFVDYSGPIEKFFGLDRSIERYRKIVNTLDKDVQFVPRIRDDSDAAVLFANNEQAALIYPQMKYHYADKLPVYASSHIYKPNSKNKNRDLDGIHYCDAPIVFNYDPDMFETPEQEALLRLYALGADAYQLINQFRLMNIARKSYTGMTGELSIKNQRRFFRELQWGSFSYGKPRLSRRYY